MIGELNLLCVDLAGLRPDERHYLRLVEEHGLSVDDVADLFDVPTGRVRRVLGRALRKYTRWERSIMW